MSMEKFLDVVNQEGLIYIKLQEPLDQYTTWKIGGLAEAFCQPHDWQRCSRILEIAHQLGINITFLGAGSNILVADSGIKGLVINTRKMNGIVWGNSHAAAEAGATLAQLSQQASNRGLRGLEFACGIPGSVGGAVIMNAGAYGSSLSNVISMVKTIDIQGKVKIYKNNELAYGYRTSILKSRAEIVVEASFVFTKGNVEESKFLLEQYLQMRKAKHPLNMPNAGSVFRNPPTKSAGRLIEEAGAKGWRVGDAQVSEQHANFIVNLGKAKAVDVLKLMSMVQSAVLEKTGVKLEPEVVVLGF